MKLSIITINLNNSEGLLKTIKSTIFQTFTNYEYIIIDGNSTDGSVNIIMQYADKITYWVSESDNGIYNAMNKGIRLASGNLLLFMNSGDIFADDTCLDFLHKYSFSPTEIVIGKSILATSKIIYPSTDNPIYLNTKQYFFTGFIPHQASFIPRQLLIDNPYNENIKFSSDYEFIMKMCFIKNIRLIYLNKMISVCDENGFSNNVKYRKLILHEILRI